MTTILCGKEKLLYIYLSKQKNSTIEMISHLPNKAVSFCEPCSVYEGLEAQHCTKGMVMVSASAAAAPVHGGSPGSIISHLSRKAVILHVLDWGPCSFAKDVSSFLKCLCFPWELICRDSCLLRRRKWQPTPVLLPGKFHGWRNLIGYSPWGHKELDTTERPHFPFALCLLNWA